MAALYLVVLFIGLLLGAVVMWRGVERHDRRSPASDSLGRELPLRAVSHWLPIGASFALSFGFIGYGLLRGMHLQGTIAILIALSASSMVAGAVFIAMKRWLVPAALRSPDDPRYALQGFPGTIVSEVRESEPGMVTYEANGRAVRMRARSVDGRRIPTGAEVVIDRIEDEVAFVELWSAVEERI